MNAYAMVRDEPNSVLHWLEWHAKRHGESHYYEVREHWNARHYRAAGAAAAFLYLNRVCFNGLWRVSRAGKFNVGFGDYANPTICDREALTAASVALQGVELRCGDYRDAIADAQAGDFVYFDPPYVPVTPTANFTSYTADGFGAEQHRELAETARALAARGVHVLLSNSDSPFVRELYSDFEISGVRCARAINSDATKRGHVDELLITRNTMSKQATIPGTDPIELHPLVRLALDGWRTAVAEAKDAKDRAQKRHDALLDAITAAGIPYYTYDEDGKRKRVYPHIADPRLKTETVASLEHKPGRRGRTKDVVLPIDKERAKAVEKLTSDPVVAELMDAFGDSVESVTVTRGDVTIEHRKVPRAAAIDDSDPFAQTRAMLEETR